ncbi:aspartate 1-decarboxylase [Pseudomonas sp. TH31]|uniref:aspartate 1-decarboxylase n=1 Tax=Pseudomonas sp. TH31 TaxID=2796396 RepID=UPI0019112E1B|nr:aspartate 1-decarboxylase [Pseudomonas sp. TH31]MBK5413968.1 aspartate 1-decarboxylase [Pseudomonas sp. TH31]
MRTVLHAKLHNAIVTEANLAYVGSITIDQNILDKVDIWAGERVMVVSNTSGARLETYVISGERGKKDICVNGAAAHLIGKDEQVIIMAFRTSDKPVEAMVAILDKTNTVIQMLHEKPNMVAPV